MDTMASRAVFIGNKYRSQDLVDDVLLGEVAKEINYERLDSLARDMMIKGEDFEHIIQLNVFRETEQIHKVSEISLYRMYTCKKVKKRKFKACSSFHAKFSLLYVWLKKLLLHGNTRECASLFHIDVIKT